MISLIWYAQKDLSKWSFGIGIGPKRPFWKSFLHNCGVSILWKTYWASSGFSNLWVSPGRHIWSIFSLKTVGEKRIKHHLIWPSTRSGKIWDIHHADKNRWRTKELKRRNSGCQSPCSWVRIGLSFPNKDKGLVNKTKRLQAFFN